MNTTESGRSRKLIILGVREDGSRFRPSDWSERLSATLASFGPDHRLRYAPGVRPRIIRGQKCLEVDACLQEQNPAAYEYIMAFARANRLRIEELAEGERDGEGTSRSAQGQLSHA